MIPVAVISILATVFIEGFWIRLAVIVLAGSAVGLIVLRILHRRQITESGLGSPQYWRRVGFAGASLALTAIGVALLGEVWSGLSFSGRTLVVLLMSALALVFIISLGFVTRAEAKWRASPRPGD
jgi:hypothetical protein